MKLIVHAGVYKTATTSFQDICKLNQKKLLEEDIFSPVLDGTGNMYKIGFEAEKHNWEPLKTLLKESSKSISENGSVLISAESLSVVLHDHDFFYQFNACAKQLGFQTIHWFFTFREHFDYFESLYAEMSKHKVTIEYSTMAESILDWHYYSVHGSFYNWIFRFDYADSLKALKKGFSGDIICYDFSKFVLGFPGKSLLQKIGVSPSAIANFELNEKIMQKNKRLLENEVELRYIFAFFNIPFNKMNYRKYKIFMYFLVKKRISVIKRKREFLREKFSLQFKNNFPKCD